MIVYYVYKHCMSFLMIYRYINAINISKCSPLMSKEQVWIFVQAALSLEFLAGSTQNPNALDWCAVALVLSKATFSRTFTQCYTFTHCYTLRWQPVTSWILRGTGSFSIDTKASTCDSCTGNIQAMQTISEFCRGSSWTTTQPVPSFSISTMPTCDAGHTSV